MSHNPAADAPLVSIGIPVYNGAEHLAESLQSVLDQDYKNLEVIVCDNASEDDTGLICQRFAEGDSRVRYLRNPSNIGLLPNFGRVRDEARGYYFSWLGHDDLFSDPAYISTVVRYLELHDDVACCHTSIYLLDDEAAGPPKVVEFPELNPERRWPDARRDLFRWPHDWLEMTSHGIFRLEELRKIPIPELARTGRPHVFCWEIDMLTALSMRARIVALPECLRAYRSSPDSMARQMGRSVSPFDLFLIDLETKVTLIFRALRASGSAADRFRLVGTAFSNLFRSTFRQRFDHRTAIGLVEGELAMLLKAAAERSRLIAFLGAEIDARRKILLDRGLEVIEPIPDPRLQIAGHPTTGSSPGKPSRDVLTDFFRPPSPAQVRWFNELNERVGRLRSFCEAQIQIIDQAEAQASALLELIHPAPTDGSSYA